MSANIFEKIVSIVVKVVSILEFAVETFFRDKTDSPVKED